MIAWGILCVTAAWAVLPGVPSGAPTRVVVVADDGQRDDAWQAARDAEQRARTDERRSEEAAEKAARAREQRDYDRARRAIDEGQWTAALDRLQEVVTAAGARADAALYWKAYALDRLGRRADALTSIAELGKTYPKSRWLGDARALEVQVRQRVGQPVALDAAGDEDLKLLALNALQFSSPDQALPMLEQLLKSAQSIKLRERALFVLAQSGSPDARRVIADVARQGNPDLQRKAIDYHGSTENRALLADLYQSADTDAKRRILRAWMVAGDRARVLAAATGETQADVRNEAVRQLGVMGAHDELFQLYQRETTPEVKREILQAMFVGGNATRLIELAKTERDAELRRVAVRNLGLMRTAATGPALVDLYTSQKEPAVRQAAIEGLFVQNNAEALVGLARKESDPAMKRAIVQRLSLMKSKAALDYLVELLGK
jgi:HEAT repeats